MQNEILEIMNTLKENENYKDIEMYIKSNDNEFYNRYHCNMYAYMRVSTEKQDFTRQVIELYEFLKKKNISVLIKNIYCDKFTGKRINREQYQAMKGQLKRNDYLITSNLSRLGRNWDDIKKEWYEMECNNINRIIIDNENLSVELPTEEKKVIDLNRKMIQDITFSACLYSACQKIEEVSQSTKDGLKKAIANGKKLGKPCGVYSNRDNFLATIRLQLNENMIQKYACEITKLPLPTYQLWLKKERERTGIQDLKELLEHLEKENNK